MIAVNPPYNDAEISELEDTGNDFIPISFGQEIIDEFIEVTDGESFRLFHS